MAALRLRDVLTLANTPQAATFTDLRAGTPIGVQYDTRDNRYMARRFFAPRRNR